MLRRSSPLDKELHSIWEILMLNDRSNDAPEVTTVRTMGLLLSRPMSMYTESRMRDESEGRCLYEERLTVRSRESPAQCGDWGAATDNELV